MKILIFQLDGKIPNIALMRVAAYHRDLGDQVDFRRAPRTQDVEPELWDEHDRVYASDKIVDWETFGAKRWQLRGIPNPKRPQLRLWGQA